MSVADDVSQLLMFSLKFDFPENMPSMSVMPVVHVVGISDQVLVLETRFLSAVPSRFVYVVPPTTPEAPSAALGHLIVTPLDAR